MNPTTVLFDLDGTLIDSFPGIKHCANTALVENGFEPLEEKTLLTFVGPPLVQSFKRWGVSDDKVAEVILSYRKHYESDGLANYSVYEGIHEVLEQLSEAGAVLAVATLKPAKFAVHIIDDAGLSKYFSYISGTTSDHSDQTKADVIREALQGIDTSASGNVVMIGDREQDALGAQETGIRFIGAGWGFGSHEEFERVSAPLICESPHQLVSIILNQG